MFSRLLQLFLIGLGLLCLIPPQAHAATQTVTNLGDNGAPGQLRTLINNASAGDIIVIPAGTIILSGPANEDANVGGDLDILKDLTLQGAGAGSTIIDGGAADGVFDILAPHTLNLSGVTIQNGINGAQAGGGGIRNFGTLNLSDAIVAHNEAALTTDGIRNNGGGIRNLANMNLTRVQITGNLARGDGGGIYNENGAVMTLTDASISGNTVEIAGGGILSHGTMTLSRVTVSGNNADTSAGGIFTGGDVVTSATATLTNVTVSGNRVNGNGGGILNGATATLINVTVAGNTAGFSGGGIFNTDIGAVTMKNVIVAANGGAVVPGTNNCAGTINSDGSNLESGSGCALTAPGDRSNTDPLLGPLQDNGGITLTQALLAGSPAINSGANVGCATTDQRGFPRDALCDIGAYEFLASTTGDFSLSLATGSLNSATVSAGATAGYSLKLSPAAGAGSISFTCTGMPQASTCTVTPNPVSAPTTLTVTVKTTPRSVAANRSHDATRHAVPLLWTALLVAGAVVFASSKRTCKAAAMSVICCALLFGTACGGAGGNATAPPPTTNSIGTPAGAFTITVTGTNGTVSHSVNLQLTVN